MVAVDGSVAAGVGGDASPAAGVSVGAVLLGLFPGLLLTHPSRVLSVSPIAVVPR